MQLLQSQSIYKLSKHLSMYLDLQLQKTGERNTGKTEREREGGRERE